MPLPLSLPPRARLRVVFAAAVFCCAVLTSGAASAQVNWKRVGTVTTLTNGQLCKTDGTNVICDSTTPSISASNFVGIGSTAPVVSLDDSQNPDAIALPGGSNAQRPTGAALVNGEIRYNNTGTGTVEAYYNGAWNSLVTSATLGTATPAAGSTGQVQFNSGGYLGASSNLFWNNSSGYLGIGTTSPTQLLTVGVPTGAISVSGGGTPNLAGTYVISGTYNSANYYQNTLGSGYIWYNSGGYWILSAVLGTQSNDFYYFTGSSSTLPIHNPWTAQAGASGSASTTALGYMTVDNLGDIVTGGVLTIKSAANSSIAGALGIGATSPNASLQIGSLTTSGTNGYGLYVSAPTGATNNYGAVFASGNVGIGTTSPAAPLSVMGAISGIVSGGYEKYRLDMNSNNGFLSLDSSSGANTVYITGSTSSPTYFNGGNVGIGTTSPAAQLDVYTSAGIGAIDLGGQNGISVPSSDSTSIAIGSSALAYEGSLAPTAFRNTAVGYQALSSSSLTTAAVKNTALGYEALIYNTSGTTNTALGASALWANSSGSNNTATGYLALNQNTTGYYNDAYGQGAMLYNTTGSSNTAIGQDALNNNTTASNNTALGVQALMNNTTGANNSGIGMSALHANTTGANNTAVGYQAGYDVTTGGQNVFLGYYPTTGVGVTIGSNNIMMGYDVRPPSQTASNQLNIGNLIYATGLGSGATVSTGNIGIGTASPTSLLHTYDGAAKTAAYTGVLHDVFDTSSTASVNKVGMDIESTGAWIGTSAVNTGLVVNATGGTTNYAATFNGGNVGIGSSSPVSSLDLSQKTDALALPGGSNAQRPTGGALVNGEIRYNTAGTGAIEAYYNGAWNSLVTSATAGTSTPAAGSTGYVQFNSGGDLAASSNFFWDNTHGRVGIGTTGPVFPLQVWGSSAFPVGGGTVGVLAIGNPSGGTGGMAMGYASGSYNWIQSYVGLPLYINPLGLNTILNSGGGNVGIGTTSPVAGEEIQIGSAASTPGLKLSGNWYTGGTATTTKPQLLVEPAGTASTAWSTGGTGIGVNAASGYTGNLMDLQLAGTSAFKVNYLGTVTAAGNINAPAGSVNAININSSVGGTGSVGLGNSTYLTGPATATAHLGLPDAASPVAQTLGVQNVVGGTSNTAGANFTITGSQGTGTGAGGAIVFQTAPASGSSGSTQNALSEAMRITSAGYVGIGTTSPAAALDVYGGTVTTSTPVINIAQTWNNASTTFDAPIFENITNTASNANSKLMDLQVGGLTKFNVAEDGSLTNQGSFSLGGATLSKNNNNIAAWSGAAYAWTNSTSSNGTIDTYITRPLAATIHLGAADAASPVAQTLGVQNVVAGTSNTAGANFTITGSQGTGIGTGGAIVFQTAPIGSSGTAQNGLAEAMRITGAGQVGVGSASPATGMKADIAGPVKVAGTGSEPCTAAQVGAIRYNPTGQYFELCSYP